MHLTCTNFTQGGFTHRENPAHPYPSSPSHRSKNIKSEYNITCPHQGKSETALMLYTQFSAII